MPADQVTDESEILRLQPQLFEASVSSALDKFVEESAKMANRHPQLLAAVERDLDVHGLKKKHIRQCDHHSEPPLSPRSAHP